MSSLPLQIARRLRSGGSPGSRAARPSVRVATVAMALGLAVMFVTLCVVIGFKEEVSRKVIGFGAHIQVVNFDSNNTYETQPISVSDTLVGRLRELEGVRSVQPFATKPGIIKTDSAFQGIVFKGVSAAHDWDFFAQHLEEGRVPALGDSLLSGEVLISRQLSRLLRLGVGDSFFCYFVQEQVNARRLKITGIYNTDFGDYDRLFILGDIRQVQRLNHWEADQYSGLEILINHFDELDEVADRVYFATANKFDSAGRTYYVQTIRQINSQLFAWLDLLDMNVWVILVLMLAVSGISLVSSLIILILDGVQLIGTLKALGADNRLVRQVFLWQSAFIILRGMLAGNLIALLLCGVQYWWHVLPLDPAAYYVSYVPISFNWLYLLLLNLGTLLLTLLMLLGPSHLIARISPAKVMRYE